MPRGRPGNPAFGHNVYPSFDDREAFSANPAVAIPPQRTLRGIPVAAVFPTSTASQVLAANSTITTPVYPDDYQVAVLNAQAQIAWGRVVNIWSEEQRAFDARISWTSGRGMGGRVFITGGGGGIQFYVVARTLQVDLANWLNVEQTIQISVEDTDSSQTQENRRMERAVDLVSGTSQGFAVPPYAREVIVASDVPTQRGNILVELRDDAPDNIAVFQASDGRIPVGAASRIRITNNDPAALASYMLDFILGYA